MRVNCKKCGLAFEYDGTNGDCPHGIPNEETIHSQDSRHEARGAELRAAEATAEKKLHEQWLVEKRKRQVELRRIIGEAEAVKKERVFRGNCAFCGAKLSLWRRLFFLESHPICQMKITNKLVNSLWRDTWTNQLFEFNQNGSVKTMCLDAGRWKLRAENVFVISTHTYGGRKIELRFLVNDDATLLETDSFEKEGDLNIVP
jgi:hypothetical protein